MSNEEMAHELELVELELRTSWLGTLSAADVTAKFKRLRDLRGAMVLVEAYRQSKVLDGLQPGDVPVSAPVVGGVVTLRGAGAGDAHLKIDVGPEGVTAVWVFGVETDDPRVIVAALKRWALESYERTKRNKAVPQ